MSRIAVIAATVAIVGCASIAKQYDTAGLTLRANETKAVPGDTVNLVLENSSQSEIGYNLCTSQLQYRVAGTTWQDFATDRVCTMEVNTLGAGEETHYAYRLPRQLDHGEYRLITWIERRPSGERLRLATGSVQIR